jgi:hypothetical protein
MANAMHGRQPPGTIEAPRKRPRGRHPDHRVVNGK